MTTAIIRLEVSGDDGNLETALDHVLDDGTLQEAINAYECDEGELVVTSATFHIEGTSEQRPPDSEALAAARAGRAC